MTKILFIIPSFHIGGTNKVLLSLISSISKWYSCSVFSLQNDCDPLGIKEMLSVVSHKFCLPRMTVRTALKTGNVRELFIALAFRFTREWKSFSVQSFFFRRTSYYLSKMRFDLVVGMEEGPSTVLASLVKAPTRIAWIHCDYSRYLFVNNYPHEESTYAKFDSIICVSNYTSNVFRSIYPKLSEKVIALYNPIDYNYIFEKSKHNGDFPDNDTGTFTIVSVGRLDPVKRYSLIPRIAYALKSEGLMFKWFIVGDGIEKEKIESLISEFNVQDCVTMTGFLTNPYPLMRASDLHVILSESEACPNVIHESMTLSVPVLAADFPTATEYIQNEKNGLIVPIGKIQERIADLIRYPNLKTKLINGIERTAFDNDQRAEEIIKHINSVIMGSKNIR